MTRSAIIIGGGSAGLFAAYYSAKSGYRTTVVEKNEKIGKKLYITGKGRCNVTNAAEPRDFLENVVVNPKFLSGAVYAFSPADLMELLESEGLKLKIERGNRVFPASDKSSDVIKCLGRMCEREGVEFRFCERALEIIAENGRATGVKTDLTDYAADKVIIATGGISYPLTGSTGDGYRFAASLGHTVVKPVPALSAIETEGGFSDLAGLSLKNVSLEAVRGGKTVSREFGEMLFTHSGISGPIVLSLSSRINRLPLGEVSLILDLKPALDYKTLDLRLLRDFSEKKNKAFKNSLDLLLPKSLIPIIIKRSGIGADKPVNSITKEERRRLAEALKHFVVKPVSLAPIDEAIVTSGGVSVKEINPKTMESKLVSGLYFAGEVIDFDALTGGFNLHAAFATGRLAGLAGEE